MIIKKPITATINKDNQYSTYLHFERGERIQFYTRGAIAWPEGDREGFVLMAGQRIDTGIIYIFEQMWFWTIDHWLNPDGSVKQRPAGGFYLGLIQAILDWDALYKCCSYFHGGQHVDVVRRHSIELYRNQLLPRRIQIIDVPYVKEVGDDLIKERLQKRGFVGQIDSPLHKSVSQYTAMAAAGVGDNNAVHCLRALFSGYEHQPFKDIKINLD